MEYIEATPIDTMKEIARRIILVHESTKPTQEQITQCEKWADDDISTHDEWCLLLDKAQGDLFAFNELKYMLDDHAFLIDSLFCEWAYIINLDTEMLEVYKGFNQRTDGKGRYASLKRESEYNVGEFYGVRLIAEFKLSHIQSMSVTDRSEWCETLEAIEDGQEITQEKIDENTSANV